jgi:hypothetical protein
MYVRTTSELYVWMLSVFALGAATGCAAIVGADDYTVDKGAGTGQGTGGSQASGGSGGNTGGGAGSGAGTGGGATGGAAGAARGGSAGVGGAIPPPDGGGAGKAGGAPPGPDAGRDAPPPTGAGETLCGAGSTCPAGQQCLMTAFSPPGLCTYSCATAACDAEHQCVEIADPAAMFPASCVKKCPIGVTCPAGLLCVPTTMIGPVCMPTGWFDGLGVGDECFADEQCPAGSACRNKPTGWCSRVCSAADSICAHSAGQTRNANGEFNWCITYMGSQSCVPGCDTGGAMSCDLYGGGSLCRAVTDVDGQQVQVCLP